MHTDLFSLFQLNEVGHKVHLLIYVCKLFLGGTGGAEEQNLQYIGLE